jgi:hypothetical protein
MTPHSVWVVPGSPAVGSPAVAVGDGRAVWLGLGVNPGDALDATDADGPAAVADDCAGVPVAGPQAAIPSASTTAMIVAGRLARRAGMKGWIGVTDSGLRAMRPEMTAS